MPSRSSLNLKTTKKKRKKKKMWTTSKERQHEISNLKTVSHHTSLELGNHKDPRYKKDKKKKKK